MVVIVGVLLVVCVGSVVVLFVKVVLTPEVLDWEKKVVLLDVLLPNIPEEVLFVFETTAC